jgi:hypothetical protein
MAHDDRISFLVLEAQRRIFRLAERDHGLCLKAVSMDSGIPYNSIRGYAAGQTVLPVPALLKLIGVIPDALLSHLFAPVSRHLSEDVPDDGDHDTLASNCIDFASKHARARHPQSPGGVEIVPVEDTELRATRRELRARA